MHSETNLNPKARQFEVQANAEWYAVQTRPRHEKVVTNRLETVGIEMFLPLYSEIRIWSDRRKVIEFPLFPHYVFARTTWSNEARVRVLQTNGVVSFVGGRNGATPIPAEQIETVHSLMRTKAKCSPHPYLTVGQRVRIRNGALQGVQGILVRIANDHSLVVSVDLIHRSLAIHVDGYEIETV